MTGGVGLEAWRNVGFPGILSVISNDLKIYQSATEVRPTLEEAIVRDLWSRRPSILEALRSYNMRAEKVVDSNVGGLCGG